MDKPDTHIFFSLSQFDYRLTHGRAYNRYQSPISFHINKINGKHMQPLAPVDVGVDYIENSTPKERQPVYKFHHSNDLDVTLQPGEYAIVPSTWTPFKAGQFSLSVYANKAIQMEVCKVLRYPYEFM